MDDLAALLDRLATGYAEVEVDGRRWGVTRRDGAGGRAVSVYAEELGGAGVVSANVYRTSTGARLKPCEMPAADVLAFLRALPVSRRAS